MSLDLTLVCYVNFVCEFQRCSVAELARSLSLDPMTEEELAFVGPKEPPKKTRNVNSRKRQKQKESSVVDLTKEVTANAEDGQEDKENSEDEHEEDAEEEQEDEYEEDAEEDAKQDQDDKDDEDAQDDEDDQDDEQEGEQEDDRDQEHSQQEGVVPNPEQEDFTLPEDPDKNAKVFLLEVKAKGKPLTVTNRFSGSASSTGSEFGYGSF